MKRDQMPKHQKIILDALSGKIDDFYLAGGTALSLFYFQHRESVDLDFFTNSYSYVRVKEIIESLKEDINKSISLVGQVDKKGFMRMAVYNAIFAKNNTVKIDFVEDMVEIIEKPKVVNGINVLSLKDIYIRKLYALVGIIRIQDETGQDKFIGGRSDAKDYYDIYHLSTTFMNMSKFINDRADSALFEAVIRWFRTYDRMNMMDELLSLNAEKCIDFKLMERHFTKEMDKLIGLELGGI